MGAFNIERIKVGEVTLGIECTLTTDAPFAYHDTVSVDFDNEELVEENGELENVSDEVGFIYPTITINVVGTTTNATYGSVNRVGICISHTDGSDTMYIDNCTVGEIITLSHPLISSSLSSHDLFDDFNYVFPKLRNNYEDSINTVSVIAGQCDVTIEYNPIVKVGI